VYFIINVNGAVEREELFALNGVYMLYIDDDEPLKRTSKVA